MRKVLTKVFSILLCACLIAGFMPGVLAVNPTSESFVHDGVTYNVAITYSEDGQKIATVTGGDVIVSAKLENGIVTVTQTNTRTGETTTTANSITQAPATASIEDVLSVQYVDAEKSEFFNVGYQVTPSSGTNYWMIWNSENIGKAVNTPPVDRDILIDFKDAVNLCCDHENDFKNAVGTTVLSSIVTALSGISGFGAIAAIISLFGLPISCATYWDNAQRAADDADFHYYEI